MKCSEAARLAKTTSQPGYVEGTTAKTENANVDAHRSQARFASAFGTSRGRSDTQLPQPARAHDGEQPGRERDLRARDQREGGNDSDWNERGRGDACSAVRMQDELVPRQAEARTRQRERREREIGSARRLLRRELVGEELRKFLRIAELLRAAFRDVVGSLGKDARTLPTTNADPSQLISELIEVGHASTASTARENCFHSSRRAASASRPDRVIR